MDEPLPAIQDVTLSNVANAAGGTFTLRVMANALGGQIDAVTADISFDAVEATVASRLEAAGGSALGVVTVVRTTGTLDWAFTTRMVSHNSLPAPRESLQCTPMTFGSTLTSLLIDPYIRHASPQGFLSINVCVTPSLRSPAASGTGTISLAITFEGYTGAVEALVVDTNQLVAASGAVVSAEVAIRQEGAEPLRGDFTLSFQGHETPALSYNADDIEVRLHVFVAVVVAFALTYRRLVLALEA